MIVGDSWTCVLLAPRFPHEDHKEQSKHIKGRQEGGYNSQCK